ncbi:intraflagellar transport-associated protein isoform X2 [Pithys albifrons albifrons]|uniref:intraflagellar transport-associated protein isoform X2 n=1 Tax=Pithys albifrons albifrons TaxID=3385563 RepID=UPI003A5CD3FC
MAEQPLENSILDQFINSHEQSYEEFLNTFTYLLKEKEGKTIQGNKEVSLRKAFSTSELSNRNKQNGSSERSKEMGVSFLSQMSNENETMINESLKGGGSDGNLSLSERVKQVDKYLDWEDIDTDEETCSGSLVLPGEVEQTVTYCTPFFDKPIQTRFRTLSVLQPSDSKAQEVCLEDSPKLACCSDGEPACWCTQRPFIQPQGMMGCFLSSPVAHSDSACGKHTRL